VNASIRPFESFRVGERAEYVRTVVAHGALSFGFMAASQTRLIGAGIIWLGASVRFTAPVRIGDTVVTEAEVVEVVPDKRLIRVRCIAHGRDGAVVLEGDSTVKCLREVSGRKE
jgi:acyl dehydratase